MKYVPLQEEEKSELLYPNGCPMLTTQSEYIPTLRQVFLKIEKMTKLARQSLGMLTWLNNFFKHTNMNMDDQRW